MTRMGGAFVKVADGFPRLRLWVLGRRASDGVLDSVAVSPVYFGFSDGLTNLRPLGPMPLTCRTVSSLISM